MTHINAGIVAHVDAGKTTLSEAMLYQTGALRKLGRVDHGDAFLDSDSLEKQRGITIFSHQANLQYGDLSLTLLDTPGHVDFASQTEAVLRVLDYAILVVSATAGVQGYTRTLWRLLRRYHVPTFIYVNKCDVAGADRATVLQQLQDELTPGCIDFTLSEADAPLDEAIQEQIAVQDDNLLTTFLDNGALSDQQIQTLITQRKVVPCYFGAALKMTGVTTLLDGLALWTTTKPAAATADFGAQVFKISHDDKGERLTWLRVTSGTLHPRDVVLDAQKVNQVRVYNGSRFALSQAVAPDGVCAVTGLTGTYPGQGLGITPDAAAPRLQPVLSYTVTPENVQVHACLEALQQLQDEDPQLQVAWEQQTNELRVQLMGAMQVEVLTQLLAERFNIHATFDAGSILYRETITAPVEGVGHFEPLRHYSEVHLRLAPGKPGSGLVYDSACSLEVLGKNWQHQVLTSLGAKQHLGVLIGAPLTDVHITLLSGRSHIKHSEGGDFRQATWRAVRQGLMMLREQGQCQVLEPWYRFDLIVPTTQVGRAMTDLQQMGADFGTPEAVSGTQTHIQGSAPVAQMRDYAAAVRAYSSGVGQLTCVIDGYRPAHDQDAIVAAKAYEPVRDLENTPDSVFCAHGAGYPVAWDEVPAMAHVPYQK